MAEEEHKSGTFRLALAFTIGGLLILGAAVIITMLFAGASTREKIGLISVYTIGQILTAVAIYFFTQVRNSNDKS